jgi:hypothetical protein
MFVSMTLFAVNARAQDNLCAEGYIMDDLCVQRGTLLDPAGTPTFVNPAVHTVHCLIDVDACRDSGFHILQDPTSEGGEYSIAYTFTDDANAMLIDLMKAEGSCTNGCTGTAVDNFRIGVKGTTQEVDGVIKFEASESAYISADAIGTYCEEGTPEESPVTSAPVATTPVENPVTSAPVVTPVENPVATEPPVVTPVENPVVTEPAESPVSSPVSSGTLTHGRIAAMIFALVAAVM